ncbi:hypothetical protein HMPREF9098_0414 [Kingella denitrificans ATCC 33394]|uniref:Uncharacterized protein n=1 Tax=Kingella denitrificans ATCC 33394 TaxID=888741 RepID=F0EX34_9NEIS|nr:hypothetical protein HMPREF9098_0414 [Kingella denitrificans ATCC 33394]
MGEVQAAFGQQKTRLEQGNGHCGGVSLSAARSYQQTSARHYTVFPAMQTSSLQPAQNALK